MDYDGQYYLVPLSIKESTADSNAYSIGWMQKRNSPIKNSGSSDVSTDALRAVQSNDTTLSPQSQPLSEKNTKNIFDGENRDSFRGESTATSDADKQNLEVAKKMDSEGKDSEKIRLATGWFKSYDGKWRNEIDDSKAIWHLDTASPIQSALWNGDTEYNLTDLLEHEELYKAYPQLKNVRVWVDNRSEFGGYVTMGGTELILFLVFRGAIVVQIIYTTVKIISQ